MKLSRRGILLLICGTALVLGLRQTAQQWRLRQSLAELGQRRLQFEARIAEQSAELAAVNARLREQNAERDRRLGQIPPLRQEITARDPDSPWAEPPTELPEWNPESPYIWLRKDRIDALRVQPFDDDGRLDPELATSLGGTPTELERTQTALTALFADFHRREAASVETIEQAPPEIANSPGTKLTLRFNLDPAAVTDARSQFGTILRSHWGEQRAELLEKMSRSWLEAQFGDDAGEPKTVSVVRHPNGTYNISIQSGGRWLSMGGPPSLEGLLPAHILPYFSPLTSAPPNAPQPTP